MERTTSQVSCAIRLRRSRFRAFGVCMLNLLERSINRLDEKMILLAPPKQAVPPMFNNVERSLDKHRTRLREVQRLRASIYYEDGALQAGDLSEGDLHRVPEDDRGWHFLITNSEGQVRACVRYIAHEEVPSPAKLRVRDAPPALRRESKDLFWKAVESDLATARRDRLRYAEVGGWAVAQEYRRTSEGLILALAAFSFGRMFGGALGMTTATVRHSSSRILRRLGGSDLAVDGTAVKPYYDPKYRCEMEVLRFDSRNANAKYSPLIDMLREKLATVLVIAQVATVKRLPGRSLSQVSFEAEPGRATA
jgi:hypothetical protein